ncbi:MAG: peptidase [Planctomycetes bacterium]|nr:peptidase [Planctomycetota bacterium]
MVELPPLDELIAHDPSGADLEPIGSSREGRPILALRRGTGPHRVSLIAGCHADEPIGPLLLRHWACALDRLEDAHPLVRAFQWWIVPHANPDGEARNAEACRRSGDIYDLDAVVSHLVRELPGEDLEFGFPRSPEDRDARPETRAIAEWWRCDPRPWVLHASLHGMALSSGPWFLIDAAWIDRTELLRDHLGRRVTAMGYTPRDVDRGGEKGFTRIAPGFTTRPSSVAMREHFEQLGDPKTAALFRPSSMETIRAMTPDALTLVSECPLFLADETPELLARWAEARATRTLDAVLANAVRPMSIRDQLELVWMFLGEGLRAAVDG